MILRKKEYCCKDKLPKRKWTRPKQKRIGARDITPWVWLALRLQLGPCERQFSYTELIGRFPLFWRMEHQVYTQQKRIKHGIFQDIQCETAKWSKINTPHFSSEETKIISRIAFSHSYDHFFPIHWISSLNYYCWNKTEVLSQMHPPYLYTNTYENRDFYMLSLSFQRQSDGWLTYIVLFREQSYSSKVTSVSKIWYQWY